ncbi:MAG: chitobiase/beta-hexosaminidase C-terminal domain-containing protein [Treponema sp.]|nr:chitobiase/beta-hexosaminidase C-terminal domain-containing protein [Treponema sp.]
MLATKTKDAIIRYTTDGSLPRHLPQQFHLRRPRLRQEAEKLP